MSCGCDAAYQPDVRPHVVSIDLGTALGAIDETEDQCRLARRAVRCRTCQGQMAFDDDIIGRAGDFCGAAVFVSYDDIAAAVWLVRTAGGWQ